MRRWSRQAVHAREPVEPVGGRGGGGLDGGAGEVAHLGQGAGLHDAAPADDADPVGELLYLGQDVAGEQDGAPLPAQLPDDLLEHGLLEGVQAGGRLVEQEQFDVGGQRGHERDLLPVALGVGPRPARGVQVEPLDQRVAPGGVRAAAQAAEQVDDLTAGEVGPQLHVARHVGQPAVQCDGVAPRVAAEHRGGAAVGADEAEQDPDGGGLARAVGAEEAVDLSGTHGEVEAVQGPCRPVGLGEVDGGDGRGHGVLR
ncbi:hypothetical protein HNR06_000830 [Nocardiopsis arvandica]|uniref:Uncharacterized protein n=1 Tax=Nocardiopsis sinuspersici TaxID=501010 RepID=A0A7Z0BHQ0_9ACTN|nr:hypothetical protein [Nocardiopsis sinuspersici]